MLLGCPGVVTPAPKTNVVIDNLTQSPIYAAYWQSVAFSNPIAAGASSDPQDVVPASANTAWVLLAPGWDPTSATPPTSFVVLASRAGYDVALGATLRIRVQSTDFA